MTQNVNGDEKFLDAPASSLFDSLGPPADVSDAKETSQGKTPYQDPGVTAAVAEFEDVPEFLGTRWRELPEENMPQVWAWLRGWVDWLVATHKIPTTEVPPCWFRHSDIVEELWAAANAETQAWEATTATMTPMTAWLFHLEMMRGRLNGRAQQCVAGKEHVPAKSYVATHAPAVLQVDEADWEAHLAEIRDTQPVAVDVDTPAASWRMCAVDEQGTVTTSEGIEVGPAVRLVPVTVDDPRITGRDQDGNVQLAARVQSLAGCVSRTWWESSTDGVRWDRIPTSEVQRGADDDDDTDGDSR